ncbi:MAG TPA: hypothetical protein VFL95_03630 [Gemmatimonadales bacterium]|jgi:hypothetical protein|nr:hypothetical protein [Gemmatimonadales bacterium]
MRWVRLLFRVFGWLLTPFLAWAASFFGCVAGAMIAARVADPLHGLLIEAASGGIVGFAVIVLWLRLLRRSPEIQHALAVLPDGTPDTSSPGPTAIDESAERGG